MTNYDDWFQGAELEQGNPRLSTEGLARRDAMRSSLTKAVVRRRRIRTGTRTAMALLVMLALVWTLTPERLQTLDAPGQMNLAKGPSVTEQPGSTIAVAVAVVQDDPSILERCSVAPTLSVTVFMGDAQLLTQLAEAGMETGIIRSGDLFRLTSDVSDQLSE